MIEDNFAIFSAAQALTTTAVSTNVIDLLNARDIGPGVPLWAPVTINTTFTGGTSLQCQLQESVDNATWVTVEQSDVIPLANLTAQGANAPPLFAPRIAMRPPNIAGLPRYLRYNYVIVGTMTAGSVDAAVVINFGPAGAAYPAGVTITN